MTPIQQLKLIISGVLLLISGFFVWNYNHMQNQVDSLKEAQKTNTAQITQLTKDSKRLDELVTEKLRQEQVIRHEREVIHHTITEVKKNDKDSAKYLDTVIPDGVRDAYRKARVESGDSH